MTNPVSTAAPTAQPVEVEFKGHKVVDGKVQPNYVALNFLRGESRSTIASLQTEYDAEVQAAAKKAEDEKKAKDEKTPAWKLVLGFVTLYYPVKFVLGTVASLFSKCCALFGYGKTAAKPEQNTAVAK